MLSSEELRLLETEALTLGQAAKLLPSARSGKRLQPTTIWRWCLKGVAGGIRLRSVVIGGHRFTTRQWLHDFIEATTERWSQEHGVAPMIRSPAERRRASERAARKLDILWGPPSQRKLHSKKGEA